MVKTMNPSVLLRDPEDTRVKYALPGQYNTHPGFA